MKARVLLPLYRSCLLSELLFLELVLDARPEEIDRLHREVEASLPLLKHNTGSPSHALRLHAVIVGRRVRRGRSACPL